MKKGKRKSICLNVYLWHHIQEKSSHLHYLDISSYGKFVRYLSASLSDQTTLIFLVYLLGFLVWCHPCGTSVSIHFKPLKLFYAPHDSNYETTFNIDSWPLNIRLTGSPETSVMNTSVRCSITQKSTVPTYFATAAWNLAYLYYQPPVSPDISNRITIQTTNVILST